VHVTAGKEHPADPQVCTEQRVRVCGEEVRRSENTQMQRQDIGMSLKLAKDSSVDVRHPVAGCL
jgi:hypothetical protein